jgi:hypothetical protein
MSDNSDVSSLLTAYRLRIFSLAMLTTICVCASLLLFGKTRQTLATIIEREVTLNNCQRGHHQSYMNTVFPPYPLHPTSTSCFHIHSPIPVIHSYLSRGRKRSRRYNLLTRLRTCSTHHFAHICIMRTKRRISTSNASALWLLSHSSNNVSKTPTTTSNVST